MHRNINKTWEVCRSLGKLLRQEGAESMVSDLLYRAVVQAALIFGFECWELSDTMMQAMDGSHMGFLIKITGNLEKWQTNGTW